MSSLLKTSLKTPFVILLLAVFHVQDVIGVDPPASLVLPKFLDPLDKCKTTTVGTWLFATDKCTCFEVQKNRLASKKMSQTEILWSRLGPNARSLWEQHKDFPTVFGGNL